MIPDHCVKGRLEIFSILRFNRLKGYVQGRRRILRKLPVSADEGRSRVPQKTPTIIRVLQRKLYREAKDELTLRDDACGQ